MNIDRASYLKSTAGVLLIMIFVLVQMLYCNYFLHIAEAENKLKNRK